MGPLSRRREIATITVPRPGALVGARPVPPGVRRRRFLTAVGNHAVLITASVFFLAPLALVVLAALMSDRQSLSQSFWPHPFQWSNFARVLHVAPLLRFTVNTMTIAGLSTVGTVVSCVPVAYALSRMSWRGRNAAFLLVLATYMLPFQVTVVPLYVIFVRLHWIGSFKPLIIPSFFGDAFSIFLLRQFFMTIPEELSDAARVDGASEFQILRQVIVPLAKPAIAAVALFNFLYNWNDLFAPLLFLGENRKLWTLTIALSQFQGLHHVDWNLMMAASILFMLPIIVLFFLAQRVFIEGVTVTGIKG